MATVIKRLLVLQHIFSNFQMATQQFTESGKYFLMAKPLVELLEVVDCGSVGGYDRNNKHMRITGDDLFDRFLTLLRKEKDAAKIEASCSADVNTLIEYFTRIQDLRHDVYTTYPAKRNKK